MLEYLYSRFSPFGENTRVSSSGDLLLHIDVEYDCDGFQNLVAFAAEEVVRGLFHLYANGVAVLEIFLFWIRGGSLYISLSSG